MFFLLTIVFSIPGALLYGPLLTDPRYIPGPGADSQVALGALFEIVVGIANVGTAVTLFPLLKPDAPSWRSTVRRSCSARGCSRASGTDCCSAT